MAFKIASLSKNGGKELVLVAASAVAYETKLQFAMTCKDRVDLKYDSYYLSAIFFPSCVYGINNIFVPQKTSRQFDKQQFPITTAGDTTQSLLQYKENHLHIY